MFTFQEESRLGYIHILIFLEGTNDPIGFIRVTESELPNYRLALEAFDRRYVEARKAENPRVTSG